ncbi:hypothetical protein IFM89_015216 [Coptis chinensis]|uniref:Uncharacterized protein n=1 Tax=Coptis chinensis TaxID=261450 RepID=A0A835LHC4_9MAGN|nr:hypothetical protein IFM89_015216 [Coptis chinensis]
MSPLALTFLREFEGLDDDYVIFYIEPYYGMEYLEIAIVFYGSQCSLILIGIIVSAAKELPQTTHNTIAANGVME